MIGSFSTDVNLVKKRLSPFDYGDELELNDVA